MRRTDRFTGRLASAERIRFHGRTKQYTEIGIKRVPCTRCGKPSVYQWQICANGRRFTGACAECDVALNEMVLEFMRIPGRKVLLERYRSTGGNDA